MNTHMPHITVSKERVLQTVLQATEAQLEEACGPEAENLFEIASEAFFVRCNPFVPKEVIKQQVMDKLSGLESRCRSQGFQSLKQEMERFWQQEEAYDAFKQEIKSALEQILETGEVMDAPGTLVQFATDATGLHMELPMLAVFPEDTEEVQHIVRIANEMGFYLVPRGGGTGLTGGAIPGLRKSVILSLSRMKTIYAVDTENRLLKTQTGVITLDAIKAAREHDLLFTVDPASKAASSIGGNVAENAGGPFAFEYGTTIDNILSYTMVEPQGELITVVRRNHPRHKIYPEDSVIFDVFDEQGSLKETIELSGQAIRAPGLGKDVSNKFLGGLPGIQKEGVDGIITEVTFILHPQLRYSQTLCLEFFGSSMHYAAQVIKDLVGLRDTIRSRSRSVTMTALEEFGAKYIRAIEYSKKSTLYEGDPISVLLIQLDSNSRQHLEEVLWAIFDIAERYPEVDVLEARDEKEAEAYWEDRHQLSAISRRTSGFKINEDVVIPLEQIPTFSDFLEELNLEYLANRYQRALHEVDELLSLQEKDEFVTMELQVCRDIEEHRSRGTVMSEQEFGLQIHYFFQDLRSRYPVHDKALQSLEENLFETRLEIANHMHAGDGNCHVNIPVHATNREMYRQAEEAVGRIFQKVLELGGEVSGEHGIGITKISYLSEQKIEALREYKKRVDPNNVINPGKLVRKEVEVAPFSISWDRLTECISSLELPEKSQLVEMLKHVQICTRCGKCKQVCPMYYPQKGYLYHPRNKNITIGSLLAALAYTQEINSSARQELLTQLRELMDFCTACGKCMDVCPVKIDSADVTLSLRSYLDREGISGSPWKSRMLQLWSHDSELLPWAAKAAALGQTIQNTAVRFIPPFWRRRMKNPVFQGPGPKLGMTNIYQKMNLSEGNLIIPGDASAKGDFPGVFYFPGCGSGLFYAGIGLAGLFLLLESGYAVLLPEEHKCCGYPLLSEGCMGAYNQNRERNRQFFQGRINLAAEEGVRIKSLLTSCGTCRASFEEHGLEELSPKLELRDVFQFLCADLQGKALKKEEPAPVIYHSSCHSAWSEVSQKEADVIYAKSLQQCLPGSVDRSPFCCAESGLGALTAPEVYNRLRKRKRTALEEVLGEQEEESTVLVSCPSCKIGLNRIMGSLPQKARIQHTLEYLANQYYGMHWGHIFAEKLSREWTQRKISTP